MILSHDGIHLDSEFRACSHFEYKQNDLNMEWRGRQVENQSDVLSCN